MHAEDVGSAEWSEHTVKRSKAAKERIEPIEFGGWNRVHKGVRHRELEVWEDEKMSWVHEPNMTSARCVVLLPLKCIVFQKVVTGDAFAVVVLMSRISTSRSRTRT